MPREAGAGDTGRASRREILCPHCGRSLAIPPGHGTRAVGCRVCRHCFRYDYATGTMTPLGRFEPHGSPRRSHMAIVATAAIAAVALVFILLFYFYLMPGKPEDAEPGSTLEEVRRQLKSLTD